MLRAAIALFLIGLLAFFLGANNFAGITFDLGRMVLFVFLALAVISFILSLFSNRKSIGPVI